MYVVYLFKEKSTGKVIYVGSSSRPCARLNEHFSQLRGKKPPQPIHDYMNEKGLKLYKDVEVCFIDEAWDRDSLLELEEEYFYKYEDTILNTRPANNQSDGYHHNATPVICTNTGETFETISLCAEKYDISRKYVRQVLIGKKEYHTRHGVDYYFKFVE